MDKLTASSLLPTIRPLQEKDLETADTIFHVAFGTFVGLADPARFAETQDYVRTRWRAHPEAALGAEIEGRLVGTNFAVDWGSVGYFGPLTIDPEFWDRGVARKLLDRTMDLFEAWGTRHAGLFTFSNSAKHVGLYQKYGFWPRFLTAILSIPVAGERPWRGAQSFSELSAPDQESALGAARELTGSVYEGLDLTREIESVHRLGLGETVLLAQGSQLAGLAVCHCGPGTEAGEGICFIKFAAVRPETNAERHFDDLLDACHTLAASRSLTGLEAGVNLANHSAYQRLLDRGHRTKILGVAMHRPDDPAYCRPELFVLGDWR